MWADALDGLVRPATDADAIAGVLPRWVATPRSTDQVAAVMRAATSESLTVVVRGAGTKQHWGAPPARLDLVLDTRQLSGVVEHAADDLVVVVRAGTAVEELAEKLAATEQQFAVDVPIPGSTIGGTVAVNTSGPRRMRYGTVRDMLIGVTMVRADGVVARSGGKVVKNVAGYDLGKLLTGSYGTLGVITECVFRLHPLPRARAFVIRRSDDPAPVLAAVRGLQVAPSAVEVDIPPGGEPEVTVLVEGTLEGVAQRAAVVAERIEGEVVDTPPPGFGKYPWTDDGTGFKIGVPLSGVPRLLDVARAVPRLAIRGSAGVGVLYAGLPADADPDLVASVVTELRQAAEYAVVVTAPPPVRDRVEIWGPVRGLPLMRRLKQQFDPDARLAPGRFVGGI